MRIVQGMLIACMLGLISCNPSLPDTLTVKKASRLIIPQKQSLAQYQLNYTLDPYNGGTYIQADTSFLPGLMFFSDGDFVEYDRYNYYEGSWYISEGKDKIHLEYQRKNRKGHPGKESSQAVYWNQSYQLLSYARDSLIIGAQGRHGIVRKVFVRVPFVSSK